MTMLHVFHINYLSKVVGNFKFNLELWINETYIYGRPLGSRALRMMASIKYAHGIHEPYFVVRFLIHNGRDKMLDIVRTTFSNAFSWMKMYGFRLRFHWSFFPNGPINNISALVQIMVVADQAANHHLNQWCLVYWRIYASLGLNELSLHHIAVMRHRFSLWQLYSPPIYRMNYAPIPGRKIACLQTATNDALQQ